MTVGKIILGHDINIVRMEDLKAADKGKHILPWFKDSGLDRLSVDDLREFKPHKSTYKPLVVLKDLYCTQEHRATVIDTNGNLLAHQTNAGFKTHKLKDNGDLISTALNGVDIVRVTYDDQDRQILVETREYLSTSWIKARDFTYEDMEDDIEKCISTRYYNGESFTTESTKYTQDPKLLNIETDTKTVLLAYNDEGKVIYSLSESKDGMSRTEDRYTYDQGGFLIKRVITADGDTTTLEFIRNERGQLIERINNGVRRKKNGYNHLHHRTRSTTYNAEGDVTYNVRFHRREDTYTIEEWGRIRSTIRLTNSLETSWK